MIIRWSHRASSPTIAASTVLRKTLTSNSYSTISSTLRITSLPAPHRGSVKIISLNRPQARNAISRQLLSDLSHQVELIHEENANGASGSTRALIIASDAEACFCAGADLKERLSFTSDQTAEFLRNLRRTFRRLHELPIPSISAISSTAFGGGLELALCTHLRVFSSNAIVALPETRLAIIPGAGGTFRLPAIIGQARARDMILTGRRVAGPEAYFLGLCDRLVEVAKDEALVEGTARKKVLDAAIQLARDICEGGPVAIKAALEALQGCAGGEASENAAYDKVVVTSDRTEALVAFREKRKPVFKGE